MAEGKRAVWLIIVIGVLVYAFSLFNGFVGDDFGQLVDNPPAHTVRNIPAFFTGGSFGDGLGNMVGIYYKPLMMTTWSIIYSVFGGRAFFFHFFQLVLHIGNSLLVLGLFKKIFSAKLSLFLALVFLLHPINSEAVLYISNLQDVLFFFFGMLGLTISLRMPSAKNTLLVILCLSCSLLSKTTGVVFLAIVPSATFIFNRKNFKNTLIYSPAILGVYALIHYLVVGTGFSGNQPFPIMRLTLGERLLNVPWVIWFYIKTFFWPNKLALGYQGVIRTVSVAKFLLPAAGIMLFICLWIWLWYKVKKDRKDFGLLLFFGCWLFLGLILHAQIIPLDFVVADRWFYLPIVGILGMIGLALKQVKGNFAIFGLIILILCGTRTWVRSLDWKDGLTLASHDTQIVKDSYSLYAYYGVELYNAGQYDKAIEVLNRSTTLAPYWHLNWNYLGQTQERKGSLEKNKAIIDQAESSYQKAINNSVFDLPYVNYAHFLIYYREESRASGFINNALTKFPASSGLWYNQAILFILTGDKTKALQAAQNAYRLNPGDPEKQKLAVYLTNNLPVKIEKANF